ncbi:MAG: TauD/TfdA family dioxygenase [Actinobacteria bacterium]|nr:TauD/TfdA family dioxygenase [Actinomycetota bacterium]
MSTIARRSPQQSAAVWRPADLDGASWSRRLTGPERAEIASAARRAGASGIAVDAMQREDFPLPTLHVAIAEWSEMLRAGRGFVLVRDFPIDLLDDREIELAYVGLGLHLGRPVPQNGAGELLTHIRDDRLAESGPTVRLYRTRQRQDFHSDGADIIGLLCLHRARRGGQSRIVSSGAVYNELLRRRPDLLEVLYRPMCWDRQGDDAGGGPAWFSLAPLNDLDGTPRLFYIGWYIRDAQRHPDVPRLTDEQLEAMEMLESIANDPAFHLEMDFQPGDVQWLNNGCILHAREAYEDDDDRARRRHLLRLWLAAHDFASVEPELRTGIRATGSNVVEHQVNSLDSN